MTRRYDGENRTRDLTPHAAQRSYAYKLECEWFRLASVPCVTAEVVSGTPESMQITAHQLRPKNPTALKGRSVIVAHELQLFPLRCPRNWNKTKNEIMFYFSRRTLARKHRNAKTAVKRFTSSRHAGLHRNSARCWNVSVFYFTYCATVEIKHFRRLETEFVLFQFYVYCEGTILDARARLLRSADTRTLTVHRTSSYFGDRTSFQTWPQECGTVCRLTYETQSCHTPGSGGRWRHCELFFFNYAV